MHLVYLAFRIFPFWAIPVAIVFAQLGVHFKRQLSGMRFVCWGIAGILVMLSIAWAGFRGDLHSDEWVRSLFG